MTWRSIILASAFAAALLEPAAVAAERSEPANGIYLLGSLHALHDRESAFDHRKLARLVEDLKPDVLVLEVTPMELMQRRETSGRPEYPKAIWTYLRTRRPIVIAMEPDEPLYGELVSRASQAFGELEKNFPRQAEFLKSYKESLDRVLLEYWTNLADTQDGNTAELTAAYAQLQKSLLGRDFEGAQKRWEEHMTNQVIGAMRAHPRARILILGSYRNRYLLDEVVRREASGRVVDTERWLSKGAKAGHDAVSKQPSVHRSR